MLATPPQKYFSDSRVKIDDDGFKTTYTTSTEYTS